MAPGATHCVLLHCAQHDGTGLPCPVCDVGGGGAPAATTHAHDGGVTLCDTCHANHGASLCTPCTLAVWGNTEFPDPADLELPALQKPPETCLDDLVNTKLKAPDLPASSSRSSHEQGTMMNEVPSASSLIQTRGNCQSQVARGLAAAAMLPNGGDEGDAGIFTQNDFDWSMDGAAGAGRLDDFNLSHLLCFMAQDLNLENSFQVVEPQAASRSPPSAYDDHWPLKPSSSDSSKTVIQSSSDRGTESLAGNNSALGLSNSAMCTWNAANTVRQQWNFSTSGLRHGGSSSVPKQALTASQDMEARRAKLQVRQEATQRYMEKRKKRRFGKHIMYVIRKVAADRRSRVQGRFTE